MFKLKNVYLPSKPHQFINASMRSGLDLVDILADLNKLVPQFGTFVEQFNTIVNENSLNVFTDSDGALFIDVPKDMPQGKSTEISNKVGVLDRLIATQKNSIGSLFLKGSLAENKFKENNPNYISELNDLRKAFQGFKDSYKH